MDDVLDLDFRWFSRLPPSIPRSDSVFVTLSLWETYGNLGATVGASRFTEVAPAKHVRAWCVSVEHHLTDWLLCFCWKSWWYQHEWIFPWYFMLIVGWWDYFHGYFHVFRSSWLSSQHKKKQHTTCSSSLLKSSSAPRTRLRRVGRHCVRSSSVALLNGLVTFASKMGWDFLYLSVPSWTYFAFFFWRNIPVFHGFRERASWFPSWPTRPGHTSFVKSGKLQVPGIGGIELGGGIPGSSMSLFYTKATWEFDVQGSKGGFGWESPNMESERIWKLMVIHHISGASYPGLDRSSDISRFRKLQEVEASKSLKMGDFYTNCVQF